MGQDTVILRAKLMPPRMPRSHVPRGRLLELLDPPRPLSFLCAPAGFGKTVAVCEWLARVDIPVAWLSLDAGDNDAARFFLHVVAALQGVDPRCGLGVTRAAANLRDSDVPVLIESLANQLHEIEEPFFLVLDDYHLIREPKVHDAVGFLVEHMPDSMHLVMTSRREPPLPLSRWRMRQLMTEIGEELLRFNGQEAGAFLNDTMGLDLNPSQAALLEERTEGWVGGLQLAALSLARRTDKDEFLQSFAGDDRYIMDYLTAEVLAMQPEETRRFLLRTSVLDRMNASLCEAVSAASGCGELLEQLERDRIFVVALDNKREWYRYHHLFQSLLLHQLAASETERARDCHLAASQWHEDQGAIGEAVQHALQAGEAQRVGELIGTHGRQLAMSGRSKQVVRWMQEIPESLLWHDSERLRAALWCEYVRTGAVREEWRAELQKKCQAGDSDLGNELALFDIYEAARVPRRYADALERATVLVENEGSSNFIWLSAQAIVASCAHALGDVRMANRGYSAALARALENDYASLFAFLSVGQGRLIALQEGPRAALAYARQSLERAAERGWDVLPVSATLLYGLGLAYWECGEYQACEIAWERSLSLGENEPSTVRHLFQTALARLRLQQGNTEDCDSLLSQVDAERYIRPLVPVAPDLGIERAWLELGRGKLDAVQVFLEERGFGRPDVGDAMAEIFGQQDAGPLLVGRYLLMRNLHERAIAVLTKVLDSASRAGHQSTVLRSRVDLAMARYLRGEQQEAMQQLDAALDMALTRHADGDASGGYHQVFANAPGGFHALLRRRLEQAQSSAARQDFLEKLIAERGRESEPVAEGQPNEPLSPSEARVLEQLIAGLSNKEIAQCLFISPNTLKTHIRRVYAKLGAKNRADAIRLARSIGIPAS